MEANSDAVHNDAGSEMAVSIGFQASDQSVASNNTGNSDVTIFSSIEKTKAVWMTWFSAPSLSMDAAAFCNSDREDRAFPTNA